jgi:hypothetical protein
MDYLPIRTILAGNPYRTFRRYSLGVVPVTWRKTLERCASLENPQAIAISIMRIDLFFIIA